LNQGKCLNQDIVTAYQLFSLSNQILPGIFPLSYSASSASITARKVDVSTKMLMRLIPLSDKHHDAWTDLQVRI
jgi:hypothetical protein